MEAFISWIHPIVCWGRKHISCSAIMTQSKIQLLTCEGKGWVFFLNFKADLCYVLVTAAIFARSYYIKPNQITSKYIEEGTSLVR